MKTLADIVGNNAVHALTADATIVATALYLCSVGGPSRVGDAANVGSGRGASLETGKMSIFAAKEPIQGGYRLAGISAYVPNGSTLTISYDND